MAQLTNIVNGGMRLECYCNAVDILLEWYEMLLESCWNAIGMLLESHWNTTRMALECC